MTHCRF